MIILTLGGEGKTLVIFFFLKKRLTYTVVKKKIRRICPAIYLAEVEIFSAFIQIFSRCSIEPTSEGMPDIVGAKNAGLTIWPLPYKVKFTERV